MKKNPLLLVLMLIFAVPAWWNDGFTPLVEDHVVKTVGVICAIGEDVLRV